MRKKLRLWRHKPTTYKGEIYQLGKNVYLSTAEAAWVINLLEYHDAPISEEEEKIKANIRHKAESVIQKSEA